MKIKAIFFQQLGRPGIEYLVNKFQQSGKLLRLMYVFLLCLFIPALTAENVMAQQVPSPEEFYGFQVGADYKLASYDMMLEYYERLDEASERVKVTQIGKSTMGRPMLLVFVSSEENIEQLDRWRRISEKMARARIPEEKARQLSREGKAIVWIDGGMHANEMAHAQMASLLAYRVATEETPEMQNIRENVVLLLMPVMNPDGLHIIKSWYERVLGTPYEATSPPWLYQKYVGHDNNRDYFMQNMQETKVVSKILYRKWYPQIVYNHHQPGSMPEWYRIWIPPFANPYNPRIHPGVIAAVNQIGQAMATRFAMKEMPGVVSRTTYTMWWNGGGRTTPYYHNMIGILTETSHGTPTPVYFPPDSMPKTIGNGIPTDGTAIFYTDPWQGGESHFRDAVEYMLTASVAVLDWAADRPQELLFNIYRMGRDAIEAGKAGNPYAYIVPKKQWDDFEALNLVEILRRGGLEVYRATESFEAGGEQYAAGSHVIYAAQAFRPYLLSLLEEQDFPKRSQYPGGPPMVPYDIAGWTLPMQMGVEVDRINESFEAEVEKVEDVNITSAKGQVDENAEYGWALSHRSNASVIAVNHLLEEGLNVYWSATTIRVDGEKYPAGTFVIERSGNALKQVQALAEKLGLDFEGLSSEPSNELYQLELPEVGIYKSWVANIDEGWTRWLLKKQYHFAVDTLHDARIQQGDLAQYDAIIIPDQSSSTILKGHPPGTMPEKYVGGLGAEGAAALKHYVEQGGTLLAFDSATEFVIEQFGLPVRNVVEGKPMKEFYIPGSLIRTNIQTTQPMSAGMQKEVAAVFNNSRAFDIVRIDGTYAGGVRVMGVKPAPLPMPIDTVATYAESDLLMSGYAIGAKEYLGGEPAILNVGVGEGNVVLYGFRPQFRGQPRGTYKLIFNALYMATLEELGDQEAED